MSKRYLLLALVLLLAACNATATPTVEPPSTEGTPAVSPTESPLAAQEGVFFSEVLPGVPGINNNLEFIELYNAGTRSVDLDGWSLWYRLQDQKEEELVYTWDTPADIPGHGHYLLVRAGQDVGNTGDAQYDTALFEKKGGLALRDAGGETQATFVWGQGPADYRNGAPAPAPDGGDSLERLPGGKAGNATNNGDDAADFGLNSSPSPQNSGDPLTPLPEQRLDLDIDLPQSVEPGAEVSYTVEIENLTGGTVSDLVARLPLPPQFEVVSLPPGASQSQGWVDWIIGELPDGGTETGTLLLRAPWTYLSALLRGAYVKADSWEGRAYGPVRPLAVQGGAIPIGTARNLKGETVTIEGVATMYTDGFYAGSTGTKFYLEDESGGIQVYCPGGKDLVQVDVGDRVRVSGLVDVYRDSMEIIPATYPDDVEVLEAGGLAPEPAAVTLEQASSDESLLGRLIAVEGTATRNEEFTYSYEVDLMDDAGHVLLAYVEKDAGLTSEPLDAGNQYRVTGISELYDGKWQIKPRYQTDMLEVFPPELTLEMSAPNSALPGEVFSYTLTAYNHTDAPLTGVQIVATPPAGAVQVAQVLDGGEWEGPAIVWSIEELDGNGASATVRYLVSVDDGATRQIQAEAATATAQEWPEPARTEPLLTFVGSGVPIWAIQGDGMASPYARHRATTGGIVIGVFPEFGGFWMQEGQTDEDPATSAGLFVYSEAFQAPVELYDEVQVSGKVRERSGQTMLELLSPEDVEIVGQVEVLPAAVELDPPMDEAEAEAYYEALEGMLVQVTAPALAVGPATKYGETPLVLSEWGIERVMRGDPTGMLIFLDDGGETTHYDGSSLAFPIKTGDLVTELIGPLAYTYENYKIEPLSLPEITPRVRSLPALEPLGPDQFSVATFNVENLFDPDTPHPDDPPIPSTLKYRHDLGKTAEAIAAMGAPTIVGLQEVENIEVARDLAAEPAIARYTYQPVLFEGTDSRGIDNAYLVRGDQVTIEGATHYVAPDGLTSRPPLVITTTLHLDSGDTTLYLLNNHFTSMSGGEKPTEPRRTAQAAWNVELVERILTNHPGAHVVVMGDLNSYYESPPLDLLREARLRHVYEFVEPERPYSYIFQGVSQTLDHILVTPPLYELLTAVEAVHIDADYPLPLPEDGSARRVSDHDPIVAVFTLR